MSDEIIEQQEEINEVNEIGVGVDEETELENTEGTEDNLIVDPDFKLSDDEKNSILDSVKIDIENINLKLEEKKSKTNDKKGSVSKVSKKASESTEECIQTEAEILANEFSMFMETAADIKSDEKVKGFIPTGIDLLDGILGGGFPIGALSQIVGQSGGGKSMLAARVIASGQKLYGSKFLAGYLDSEVSMSMLRLANLGVVSPKIKPYSVDITVEKIFKFIEGVCLFKEQKGLVDEPSIIVWDSIANTLSSKELEAEAPENALGKKAAVLSLLIPKYLSKLLKYNICFLTINQYRDYIQINKFDTQRDLKMMSDKRNIPGGKSLKFNSFQLMDVETKKILDIDSQNSESNKYKFNGLIVKVKCIKNKQFTPNIPIELICSFNHGFSNFWTNFNLLTTTKRLKTGAWNSLVTLPDVKFRTSEALLTYNENEKFREAFNELSKDAIQKDVIEKYAGF